MNILLEEYLIKDKVAQIAAQINDDYMNKNPVIVGILKGAFVFMSDLIRHIEIPVEIDFLCISSYNGKASSGVVRLSNDLSINIEDRDVIVVEDIIDSGRTISFILSNLETRHPRSLAVCTLLNKNEDRVVDVPLTYVGFNIPSVFAVGYGLDHKNQYRNLPYIGVFDGS
ncbi:hypoxanthine phosphoribosyltransferase [candidate division WOR-3 bacterium]|nr:hypoxanthine phosphoribosyltransferase [candidate division WOR-3 bacterium]